MNISAFLVNDNLMSDHTRYFCSYLSVKIFIFSEKTAFLSCNSSSFKYLHKIREYLYKRRRFYSENFEIERNLKKPNTSAGAYSKEKLDFWQQI